MFTRQYLHTSAHRSLEYLLKPWEDNMFKVLKDARYHVCSIGPRGDWMAPGVTETSFSEVSYVYKSNTPPRLAREVRLDRESTQLAAKTIRQGCQNRSN